MNRYQKLVRLEEAVNACEYGGKASHLSLAIQNLLPVPKGFVISSGLLNQYISGEFSLGKELNHVINELGSVAVRSSAIGEDSKNTSFAGQYISCLNAASIQEIEKAIFAVWESAFSKRVLVYNEKFGIANKPKLAIILQQMVPAKVSGILFTQDPVSKANETIIEASWGLGDSIASGQIIPDFFRLSTSGRILEKRLGEKDINLQDDLVRGYEEDFCLTEKQLQELQHLAECCENVFGRELDIEWAFDQQNLFLLQCRPITC